MVGGGVWEKGKIQTSFCEVLPGLYSHPASRHLSGWREELMVMVRYWDEDRVEDFLGDLRSLLHKLLEHGKLPFIPLLAMVERAETFLDERGVPAMRVTLHIYFKRGQDEGILEFVKTSAREVERGLVILPVFHIVQE